MPFVRRSATSAEWGPRIWKSGIAPASPDASDKKSRYLQHVQRKLSGGESSPMRKWQSDLQTVIHVNQRRQAHSCSRLSVEF